MTTTKPQADVQAALDNMAQEYVFQIHGRGLSTSVGVQTRRLLHDAFVAGFKSATTQLTKPQENVTCGGVSNAEFLEALRDCRVAVKTGCTEHALAFIEKAIARADKAAPVGDDIAGDVNNPLFTALDMICHGLFVGREHDIRRHAAECLKAAGYDNHNIRAALSQPKQSAPVERIEGLEEVFAKEGYDPIHIKNKFGKYPNQIVEEAARAYLKLQGGE